MMIVLMTMSGTAVKNCALAWVCALDQLTALPVCSTLEYGCSSACSLVSRQTTRLDLTSKGEKRAHTPHDCPYTGNQVDGLGLDAGAIVACAEAGLSLCAAPSNCGIPLQLAPQSEYRSWHLVYAIGTV